MLQRCDEKADTMRETTTLEFKQQLSKSYPEDRQRLCQLRHGKDHFRHRRRRHARRIDRPQGTCLRVEHAINDSIDPVPRFELSIEEDTRTVTLTVHEGPDKPYLFSGRAYRRADTSTVEVSRLEYGRLVFGPANMSASTPLSQKNRILHLAISEGTRIEAGGQTTRSEFPYFA